MDKWYKNQNKSKTVRDSFMNKNIVHPIASKSISLQFKLNFFKKNKSRALNLRRTTTK